MGDHVTINGVEIDHNDFTDTSYTTRNWSCGDEAGGVKWVTNNMTIENSTIHDNACKGLWADLNGDNAVITNNQVVQQLGRRHLHRDLVVRHDHRQHGHRQRVPQLQRQRQRLPVALRRRHHARRRAITSTSATTSSPATATASPASSRTGRTVTPACSSTSTSTTTSSRAPAAASAPRRTTAPTWPPAASHSSNNSVERRSRLLRPQLLIAGAIPGQRLR